MDVLLVIEAKMVSVLTTELCEHWVETFLSLRYGIV